MHTKKRMSTHSHTHQLGMVLRYLQSRAALETDSYRLTATTAQPVMDIPLQLETGKLRLQVPTIRIVIPELWCCPMVYAQETTSSFCQALCLYKYPLPRPCFSRVSTQTLPSLIYLAAFNFRGNSLSLSNQFLTWGILWSLSIYSSVSSAPPAASVVSTHHS